MANGARHWEWAKPTRQPNLDAEQRRAAEEGLSEDELAMFELLFKDNSSKADRDRFETKA